MLKLTLELDYETEEELFHSFMWEKYLSKAIDMGKTISFKTTTEDEPEWFGVVRWCDEDIVAALEYKLAPVTEENIRRIHDKLAHHSFTDSMIEQGWDYIHFLIDTELT